MGLDLYKEFYDREWERHEHLQSAVNTPISIVTLLAGGLVLMGKSFASDAAAVEWSFWIAASAAASQVVVSVYFLIRSIHGYRYDRIPLPAELALHHERLKRFYRDQEKPGLADPALEAFLTEKYITAADHNAVNNMERGEYLYRVNRALVLALCATAAAGIPAAIAVKQAPHRPDEVRITNLRSEARAILEAWEAERDGGDRRGGSRASRAR